MNAHGTECREFLAQTKMGWFCVLHHSSFVPRSLLLGGSYSIFFSNPLNLAEDTFIPVAESVGPGRQTS